jgi:hypothetical protein
VFFQPTVLQKLSVFAAHRFAKTVFLRHTVLQKLSVFAAHRFAKALSDSLLPSPPSPAMARAFLFLAAILSLISFVHAMRVGVGIYDMTGPSVEINFMGYAAPGQRGTGIHQRLRARAFAFDDDNKRCVFVSVDGGMGSDLVNKRVIERLDAELGPGVYTLVGILLE